MPRVLVSSLALLLLSGSATGLAHTFTPLGLGSPSQRPDH